MVAIDAATDCALRVRRAWLRCVGDMLLSACAQDTGGHGAHISARAYRSVGVPNYVCRGMCKRAYQYEIVVMQASKRVHPHESTTRSDYIVFFLLSVYQECVSAGLHAVTSAWHAATLARSSGDIRASTAARVPGCMFARLVLRPVCHGVIQFFKSNMHVQHIPSLHG